MNASLSKERLDARTNTFLLLRRLFEKELDDQTAYSIAQTGAANVLLDCSTQPATLEAVRFFSTTPSDKTLDALRTEYMHMFVGPGHLAAPFWESVYLDDRELLFLENTSDVRRAYEREGLKVAAQAGREAEDALFHECDFIAQLSSRTSEAICQNNFEEAVRLLGVQLDFEKKHMADWLPLFANRAAEYASGIFYPNLCASVNEIVADDIVYLERALDEAQQ